MWRQVGRGRFLVVGLLVLAACGGGDDDDAVSSSTSVGTAGSVSSSAPSVTVEEPASTVAAPVGTGAAGSEARAGGTLVYGVDSEIAGWASNELAGNISGEDRGQLIYDTLLLIEPDGDIRPNIAEEMTTTDGVTWKMRLRPGVEFTDGTPLDAEAVVWNVELTLDPESGAALRNLVSNVQSVRAVDPLNVEFVLGAADGSFPYAFVRLPGQMMSPTAYEADPTGFSTNPVGAGPFMLESWVRDSTSVLVRNPDYWDAPKPYLDKIEVQVLSDHATRAQTLVTGQTDLVANAAPVAAMARDDDRLQTFPLTGFGTNFIALNQDHPPFDDIRIREAVALAIDPEFANDALLQGALSNPGWVCPPYRDDAAECLAGSYPAYDLERAKALVKEYTDEGHEFGRYSLILNTAKADVAEFVQQAVREIGIEVEIELLEIPDFLSRYVDGDCDFCMNEIGTPTAASNGLYLSLHSAQRHAQKGPVDPELDKLLEDAQWELDFDDRIAAAQELQRKINTEFTLVYVSPTLRGMVGSVDVHLGDALSGGGLVGQNIWLDE